MGRSLVNQGLQNLGLTRVFLKYQKSAKQGFFKQLAGKSDSSLGLTAEATFINPVTDVGDFREHLGGLDNLSKGF